MICSSLWCDVLKTFVFYVMQSEKKKKKKKDGKNFLKRSVEEESASEPQVKKAKGIVCQNSVVHSRQCIHNEFVYTSFIQ